MKYCLMALLSLVITVSAPSAAKQQPPEVGKPKDFNLAGTTDFELENGLNVTLIPYGNTPKATISIVTQTGSYYDGDLSGLSELSYQLLTQGTEQRTDVEIAQAAASMGGTISTGSDVNSSFLFIDVLSEFTPDAASLLAELVTQATIPQDALQRVKNNRLRQLDIELSEARTQANIALYQAIYADHPYARVVPNKDILDSISTDDVKNFLKTNLTAKRSHVYVVGKFDAEKTTSVIRQTFSTLATGQSANIVKPEAKLKSNFTFVARKDAPQSTLRLGLPVVDPTHDDYVALGAMNTLLGGSFASRITANIREDKGYTYSPSSTVSPLVKSGLWYQSADVTAESTAAALKEIIKEITRLREEPPSQEELAGIKRYSAGIFVLRNSSRFQIFNQLWFYKNHGLDRSVLEKYLSDLNSVTPEQISTMAKKYLTPENMTLVVVGDEETVKPQLENEPALNLWLAN